MSFPQSEVMIDRAVGMVLGTAVGDAMGIPFENLTPEQIAEIQMSLKQDDLLFVNTAGRNPYIPKEWATGRWGDATQLSLAIMHAITKHLADGSQERSSLIEVIADEHVKEWWDCTDGWGNGTKSAIEKLARATHTYQSSGGSSTGNGVMMKVTPIAFFFFHIRNRHVDEQLVELVCRMTHMSSVTIATTFIYLDMCMFTFERGFPSSLTEKKEFLLAIQELSLKYESKYHLSMPKDLLSSRVQRYLAEIDGLNDQVLLDVSHGGTFFCVDTLSMVFGLIATQPMTFATLEKALQMGGDTNIVAAMLGALLGAVQGQQAIDRRRSEIVYRAQYVREVGEEFGQALVQYLSLSSAQSSTL